MMRDIDARWIANCAVMALGILIMSETFDSRLLGFLVLLVAFIKLVRFP